MGVPDKLQQGYAEFLADLSMELFILGFFWKVWLLASVLANDCFILTFHFWLIELHTLCVIYENTEGYDILWRYPKENPK